jgi:NAD(P)H-hydrate repair Nnr-like enzyme with NAD(P)H-hydrate dehydratase domain
MKREEKAAIKAAGATAVLAGAVAATIANPVAWAAVLYGAYRMGKTAYQASKDRQVSRPRDEDLFI